MSLAAPHSTQEKPTSPKSVRIAEAAFAVAILALALAGYLLMGASQADAEGGHSIAVVSRDGAVLDKIDLDAAKEPFEVRFEDERGLNVAQVNPGRIRIVEADCPDKVCAHAGWIDRPGAPIACVPHGLTITIENQEPSEEGMPDGIDATTR